MSIDLLTQEKVVLDIVHDYLNHKRQFDIDDIVPYINFRLRKSPNDLNYQGIKSILKTLVKKNFLIEGSKLTSEDVLTNEKRKIIYDYIIKNPGSYFTKIVKKLSLSNHVVVWHLNILLKFNFIKKRIIDKHEIYFDSKVDVREAKFKFYISLEKSNTIIQYLKKNNIGVTKTKLSKALEMHLNTISKYINILQKIQVIYEEKIDHQTLFFLNESLIVPII
jgi:predicted transcriptional regulator